MDKKAGGGATTSTEGCGGGGAQTVCFECSICLEPMGEQPVVTPCGHLYCRPCVAGACHHMQSGVLRSNAGCLIGSVAVAVVPWAFPDGQFPPRPALLHDGRRRGRAEDSLHQIWLFLAAFALFSFLLF